MKYLIILQYRKIDINNLPRYNFPLILPLQKCGTATVPLKLKIFSKTEIKKFLRSDGLNCLKNNFYEILSKSEEYIHGTFLRFLK